ncbi:F-box only protein 15 [Chelonia mydas]|uniref:F-box only protein 15 n=1 Tax=Chelonia mydas TaxID=8469 RepID=M7BCF2_CHEMY|nr:F-box only protein 15 [Chelonia mydas]
MPSEILLKIFSYLDAVSLLCIGCVNKRFYHLASDKTNWKTNSVEKTAVLLSHAMIQDRELGYWKNEYIMKQIAAGKTRIIQLLKPINPYTGLPLKTKEAIKTCSLNWVIVLKDRNGKEHVMEQVDISFNDTSVTVFWYGTNWPCLDTLSTLELCGVTPLLLDQCKVPPKNGQYILPPHKPILDDVDPEYGLHGYQLHIDMHSGGHTYMCGTFRNLFCRKDYIQNGYLRLTVISLKNNSQHLPLAGKVGFFWRTDVFKGSVQTNNSFAFLTTYEGLSTSPAGFKGSDRSSGGRFIASSLDAINRALSHRLWYSTGARGTGGVDAGASAVDLPRMMYKMTHAELDKQKLVQTE